MLTQRIVKKCITGVGEESYKWLDKLAVKKCLDTFLETLNCMCDFEVLQCQ